MNGDLVYWVFLAALALRALKSTDHMSEPSFLAYFTFLCRHVTGSLTGTVHP